MWRWMWSCSGWRVVRLTKPRIGSLFSGYGGLDLAVESFFDADTAWHCEWDDAPSKILAHHWPDVPNFRDVTTVNWSEVPPVDIITGGSPCQDLSAAGKRAGMTEGTRSNLWVNMREAINQLRPRLVVWENVRGALSATATSESDMEPGEGPLGGGGGHLRALGRVLGDLASIGYDARWQLLRASDVGAPHHRARVFLVAYPANTGSIGLQAARRDSGPSASLAGLVGGSGALPGDLTHLPTPTTRMQDDTASQRDRNYPGLEIVGVHFPEAVAGEAEYLPTPDANPGGGGQKTAEERRADNRTVSVNNAVMGLDTSTSPFGKYVPVVRRWEQVTGMAAPAPTEPNRNGKPRLNAAFAEWMMGLPAGWVTEVPGVTRAQQLKACGNGVVPQQAAAALAHLIGGEAPA